MPKEPKDNRDVIRTVIADTMGGLVNLGLPGNRTANQPADPGSTTNATAVAGDYGTASTQTGGTAVSGIGGSSENLRYGVAIADADGTATGGADTVSIVMGGGLASTGDGGIAFAKRNGEATVSGYGIAIAFQYDNDDAAVVSATGGVIIIGYQSPEGPLAFTVGRIGRNGIKSGVRYTLDKEHRFVEVPATRRAR